MMRELVIAFGAPRGPLRLRPPEPLIELGAHLGPSGGAAVTAAESLPPATFRKLETIPFGISRRAPFDPFRMIGKSFFAESLACVVMYGFRFDFEGARARKIVRLFRSVVVLMSFGCDENFRIFL